MEKNLKTFCNITDKVMMHFVWRKQACMERTRMFVVSGDVPARLKDLPRQQGRYLPMGLKQSIRL